MTIVATSKQQHRNVRDYLTEQLVGAGSPYACFLGDAVVIG